MPLTRGQPQSIGHSRVQLGQELEAGMETTSRQIQPRQAEPDAHTVHASENWLSHQARSPHIAWASDASQWPAGLSTACEVAQQTPNSADLLSGSFDEGVSLHTQGSLSSTHTNILFDKAGSVQTKSSDSSRNNVAEVQRCFEAGWASMQHELQKFRANILAQLAAVQTTRAAQNGSPLKSQKGTMHLPAKH